MEGKKAYRLSARLFFIVQFLFCIISNLVQYFGQVSQGVLAVS